MSSERTTLDSRPALRSPHIWWVAGLAGGAVFVMTHLLAPGGREDGSLPRFAAHLTAFALVSVAVAFLPFGQRAFLWLVVPFVALTGYVLPRISWFYYGDVQRAQQDAFYNLLYAVLYPGIVLAVMAAFRVGGGSPGRCLKIGAVGMILIFSGFLDIMWQVVNPVDIPNRIDAPHITVITGRPLSFEGTILFALMHLPLVVAFCLAPIDRWIASMSGEPGSES